MCPFNSISHKIPYPFTAAALAIRLQPAFARSERVRDRVFGGFEIPSPFSWTALVLNCDLHHDFRLLSASTGQRCTPADWLYAAPPIQSAFCVICTARDVISVPVPVTRVTASTPLNRVISIDRCPDTGVHSNRIFNRTHHDAGIGKYALFARRRKTAG